MYKTLYSSHWLKKRSNIFTFSHINVVKLSANYAEISRVGHLEADFQQLLFVHYPRAF